MNSSSSSSVQVIEDVAIIILRHLAEERYHGGPYTHWIRLRGVSKAFDRVVCRYLSKTVEVGVEEAGDSVEIFQCFQDGGVDNYTRTLFESKDTAVAFLRCIASYVDKPIAIDLVNYIIHPEDDDILESLCNFQAIKSIIYRRPQCECAACERLEEHAGPDVLLIEESSSDGSDSDMFYGSDDDYFIPRHYSSDDFDDTYDDLNSHDVDENLMWLRAELIMYAHFYESL